jgi:hypothetical protein
LVIGHLQTCKFANLQPATCNLQPATCNLQPATCNLQPATCNLQPATCNLHTHFVLRLSSSAVCGPPSAVRRPPSMNFTSGRDFFKRSQLYNLEQVGYNKFL